MSVWGLTAGLFARQINQNVEHILSLELMSAAQGIDFRKQKVGPNANLGRGTRLAYEQVRMHVPFIERDTILYPYIDDVRTLVKTGAICPEWA